MYVKRTFDFDIMVELTQGFLFIAVMVLPFEIRDLEYDEKELETIC